MSKILFLLGIVCCMFFCVFVKLVGIFFGIFIVVLDYSNLMFWVVYLDKEDLVDCVFDGVSK